MTKQRGLGRGLGAIFGNETIDIKVKPMAEMAEIKVADCTPNPTQPRRHFDETALEELADSIRTLGLIQPITVRKDGDKYLIISGERRWRAAQLAGVDTVPAYIRDVDDENLHAMALVENIQRQDLNAIEIALGMQRLIEECGLTQEAMADKVTCVYVTTTSSPEDTWNEMIKEIHGDHYYVTEEQWNTLLDQFESEGIPTYVIVDKEGNVVNKYVGFPGVEIVTEELGKLL